MLRGELDGGLRRWKGGRGVGLILEFGLWGNEGWDGGVRTSELFLWTRDK